MIVLLLGTNPYPFSRLLNAIDDWAGATGAKVIAQTGHTPPIARHVECHPFVGHEQVVIWLRWAELAVAQGGFGSIRDCLVEGRPTVVVPRRVEVGECQDDQTELVEALSDEGWVIPVYEVAQLGPAIERARAWSVPVRAPSRVPEIVREAVLEVFRGSAE